MEQVGGEILVHSNASAEASIDGESVGSVEPNAWTSFGHFEPGAYTVRATTPLGSQEQTVTVAETASARAQFAWGSRLVVSVEPAGIVSLTLAVDEEPYTGPVEISAEQLGRKAFVQVEANAPGYKPWAEVVFLKAGDVTNVEVVLKEREVTTGPTPTSDFVERVLSAYWRMWEVWDTAAQALDPAPLADVMTGALLEPDGVFSLTGAGVTSTLAFLEVDRATESLRRWAEKIEDYNDYFLSGRFAQKWEAARRVVVLITAPDSRRVEALRRFAGERWKARISQTCIPVIATVQESVRPDCVLQLLCSGQLAEAPAPHEEQSGSCAPVAQSVQRNTAEVGD